MAANECSELRNGSVLAEPHTAPYTYDAQSGYQNLADDQPSQDVSDGKQTADVEEIPEDDEDYEDSDDEVDLLDNDISSANPSDYTKSYNRQRRLLDPATPASQLPRTNPQQKPQANVAALIDDQITSLARHAGKLKLDDQSAGVRGGGGSGGQERSDRATNEQVLDPRTRMILLQMINRAFVSEIHGCVSTGKEANVYYALLDPAEDGSDPKHLAIKIYKTAILQFKDRSKYVSGEFRFQKGFPKRSNRGMVRLWAEKEFRNLRRMHSAGLPVPEPFHFKSHVLVMGFIGTVSKSGRANAAPLLRDIEFDDRSGEQQAEQWQELYRQTLRCMRTMYQVCKLVHADLSEYNMLYDESKRGLMIIDVSQSVEHDHPRSLEFLRMDVKNVSSFFARKGAAPLTEPSAYYFITNESLPKDLDGMNQIISKLQADPVHAGASDEVFRQQYIPQTLSQVPDHERVAETRFEDGDAAIGHGHLLAKGNNNQTGNATNGNRMSESDDSSEKEGSPSSLSGEQGDEDKIPRTPRGKRFEDKAAKKQHKAAVKEEKKERRRTKMPKHMKKKLVTGSSRSHKK